MLTTAIIFIIVLSLLVFAHELGHFWTARRLGVKAEEFGFGFPPRAIGFYRNRLGRWRRVKGNRSVESLENSEDDNLRPAKTSTIYSLNWLPLGGFVKIKGENGDGQAEPDSFAAKPIWKRLIILSAGVIMNVILAWFLFSAGYMFGLPQSTSSLGSKAQVSGASVIIAEVMPGSPAENAGLLIGDSVLSVNGQAVATEGQMQAAIAASGASAELYIVREGKEISLEAKPADLGSGKPAIGVAIYSAGLVRYPFLNAIWEGAKTTGWIIKEITVAFVNLFAQIFSGQSVSGQFAGPVGIAEITGQAARQGWGYLIQFVALLSLNLAFINILPFPALDGGRILFLIIEKFKGRPVRRDLEALIHNIGFIALIALVLFITYKDIIKLF